MSPIQVESGVQGVQLQTHFLAPSCTKDKFCPEKWIYRAQCAPGFFNPNQKVHGLFHFYKAFIYETIKNQLKKSSDIGLPNQ